MKLLFKQRFFSWFDSYDIYDEAGNTVFTVEGQLALGHTLHILDNVGEHIATLRQKLLTFMPKSLIYKGDELVGSVEREFALFTPRYNFDFNGWHVEGDVFEWDYTIMDQMGNVVASVQKELFHFTDTYVIEVNKSEDALDALMFTLAIDVEKCSRR